MAGKAQNVSNKNTVTLKAIEEHLKRQDKEIKQSAVWTLQAFGITVFLAGVSFLVIPKILWYGLFLMGLGALFVVVVRFWNSRIGKK
jgi:Flp pilus assembly protein TadB